MGRLSFSFQRWLLLTATLLCFPSISLCEAIAGDPNPHTALSRNATKIFLEDNFTEFDKLLTDALVSKARFPHGTHKSQAIVQGLQEYVQKEPAGWSVGMERVEKWALRDPKLLAHCIGLSYVQVMEGRRFFHRTATSEQIEIGKALLAESEKRLKGCEAEGKKTAVWYSLMMRIGARADWPVKEIETLYNSSVEIDPDYFLMYYQMATYYLGGTKGDEFPKLKEFLATFTENPHIKNPDVMYARVVSYLDQEGYLRAPGQIPWVDWEKTKRGYNQMMQEDPDHWYVNTFTRLSCERRDRAEVVKLMPKLEASFDSRAWPKKDLFQICKRWSEIPA